MSQKQNITARKLYKYINGKYKKVQSRIQRLVWTKVDMSTINKLMSNIIISPSKLKPPLFHTR